MDGRGTELLARRGKKEFPPIKMEVIQVWVRDKVKDLFRKALDREMVKAWVKAVCRIPPQG